MVEFVVDNPCKRLLDTLQSGIEGEEYEIAGITYTELQKQVWRYKNSWFPMFKAYMPSYEDTPNVDAHGSRILLRNLRHRQSLLRSLPETHHAGHEPC